MDSQDLKKMLAGLSITALLVGATLTISGCATTAESS
ncbi:MAG: selenobiotic family radical SAM modification target peptide [Nitrospirae bacterium]|nr:selenobiotic family radical SAM modification target peptide [Nitrospirota bacterium]